MGGDEDEPHRPSQPLINRPARAAAGLVALYVALSFLMSPGGYLGTDTGAKVATLEVMVADGTVEPNVGYWAERWDPDGRLHPIVDSVPVDGGWVHVTTLPMLELALPLYAIGGYRLALLLPMAGALGAAFAGRAIARRAYRSGAAGWTAFWAVGVVSPVTVYALDLWEHAPGVAFMTGAAALLMGIVDGERWRARAAGAGALLGLSATMRTETFVYAIVLVGAAVAILGLTGRMRRFVEVGGLTVAGFAGPWLANAVLESVVGGQSRGDRVTGRASGGVGDAAERAREAVITLLALRPDDLQAVVVLGGMLVTGLVAAVVGDRLGNERLLLVGLSGSVGLHLATLLSGLGFVPGLVAAAPIAIVGVLRPSPTRAGRYVRFAALAALPVVWAFQYLGGALPQWGGRYALTTATLLVALGAGALAGSGRLLRWGLLGLAGLVTLSGALWLSERSHEMDRLFDELVDRPEDVVVSRNGFLIREGGPAYTERLWLTAIDEVAMAEAARVVERSGHDTFAVLDQDPAPPGRIGTFTLTSTTETSVVGVRLFVHAYALSP